MLLVMRETELTMGGNMNTNCPECNGNYIVNAGILKRRIGNIQRYKCNNCGRFFTEKKMLNKQYPPEIILYALCLYNKGFNLEEASREVNRRYRVNVYHQLISTWLKQYKEICSYQRIRKEALEEYNFDNIAFSKKFSHKQVYEFSYHKFKIEKFINNYFQNLREYLENLNKNCPDGLFNVDEENARGSKFKINVNLDVRKIRNYACLLAELALKANRDNKKRHREIQEFMLFNDSSTLAIEIPVWLYPNEFDGLKVFVGIDKPITGHIDIIQQRFGLIHILDYKPDAEKENPTSQLFFYAFALSKRTGIWLRNFRCAWFNENGYYEFNPNEIILKNGNLSEEEKKKYKIDYNKSLFHENRMFNEWESNKNGILSKEIIGMGVK